MKPLHVKLGADRHGAALVTVEGLPGDGAELRPHELRDLAAALVRIASDAERRKLTHRGRRLPDLRMLLLIDPGPAGAPGTGGAAKPDR